MSLCSVQPDGFGIGADFEGVAEPGEVGAVEDAVAVDFFDADPVHGVEGAGEHGAEEAEVVGEAWVVGRDSDLEVFSVAFGDDDEAVAVVYEV